MKHVPLPFPKLTCGLPFSLGYFKWIAEAELPRRYLHRYVVPVGSTTGIFT